MVTGSLTPATVEGCNTGDAPPAAATVAALEALPGGITISDACSPDGSLSVIHSDASSGSCPIIITRTYTVTDECGNYINIVHTINVDDNTAPVVAGSLTPVNIEGCNIGAVPSAASSVSALEAMTGGITITDACTPDASLAVSHSDAVSGTCPIVITRTYTVTDVCGNFVHIIHTINIDDTQPPVVAGSLTPASVEGCSASDAPAAAVSVAALEALAGGMTITDGCTADASLTVSHADVASGTCPVVITRTYKITDACGNFVTIIHTLNVNDTQAPVVTGALTPETVEGCSASAAPAAVATVAGLEALPGGITINDACTPDASLTVSHSDLVTGTCPILITRTYTVRDACGNFVNVVHIINVDDSQPPVVTGSLSPAAAEGCDAGAAPAAMTTVAGLEALPGGITITDACTSDALLTVTHSDAASGSCPLIITRTYTITDECGNVVNINHIINIDDNTSPVVTGSLTTADVEGCNATDAPPAATTVAELEALPGSISITDACTANGSLAVSHTDAGSGSCPLIITRTYTVTDACGNFVNILQTINVDDTQPPVVTGTLDPVTVEGCDAGAAPAAVASVSALEGLSGGISITDACSSDAMLSVSHSDVPSGTCPLVITRTYTVTDACGNSTDIVHTINIEDSTPPVIAGSLTPLMVEGCDAGAAPAAVTTVAGLEALTGGISVTDGCTPDASLTVSHSDLAVGIYPVVITRTYTVTDACGNSATVEQVINIVDITSPVLTCPIATTISCEDDNTPAGTGTATATDNCSAAADIAISFSDASTYNGDPLTILHYNYTITRTWKAIDLAGNYSECTQIITVRDITGPVITCPGSITINCEDDNTPAGTGTATATDNCTPSGNILVSFSDLSTYNSDPSDILHYNYTINRTWKATDKAGNHSECTQIVTVQDVTGPVITCPVNSTINCEEDNTPAGTGTAGATDNCTPAANIVITSGDISTYNGDPSTLLHYNYTIARTWTATDIAGNYSECTQTITVNDITKPVYTVPQDITICRASDCTYNTDPSITGEIGDASDNCSPASLLNITYNDDPSGLTGCDNFGFIIRTWTVRDVAGNATVRTQTIRIEPTPRAVISTTTPIICDGGNIDVTLSSPTVSDRPADLSYEVEVTSTDPAHIGGGASGGFTKLLADLPFIISGDLTNSSDAPIVVTYTVTPKLNGCSDGPLQTVSITVNPTPQVLPDSLIQRICNDATTNVTLGSQSSFTSGVISFRYTVTATGGVTGFTTPVAGLSKDHVIADILHNPSDSTQTVTYNIIPVSPTGCPDGPGKTVVIKVSPTPKVVPDVLAQTICNDGITNIALGSPSRFENGVVTFNYTVVATGGVTGFSTPVTDLPEDHVIAAVLHNPTDSPQTVTYTIVPVSPTGCPDGPASVVVITVNPTPQVVPGLLTQTICNDAATNVTLGSPSTFTSGVITFNYTVTTTGGTTGFTTPSSGLAKDHIIADILHNPGDSPDTVTYTIVPVNPAGCMDGPARTVVIIVNPTPRVVPGSLTQTICNDAVTNVTLGSPSTFTNGVITFNYTVTATGGVTGFTTPVTGLVKDHIIADILHNPGDSPETVTYTITPLSPAGCPAGPDELVVVTVDPTPQAEPGSLTQTICNDATTNVTLGSPSTFATGVITFNYTVVATGGVTGFTTPVTGLPRDHVIADTLHNPGDSPETVTYTITPVSPAGCTAGQDKVVVITVNPTPKVVPGTLTQTICNDAAISVTLASPSTFTSGVITFNYTVTATGGVTGFTTPVTGLAKDHIIADILHNPGDSPETVTYTITPVSPTGCPAGPDKLVVITVDPTPQAEPGSLSQTICNDVATNVILGSPSTFATGVITFDYTVVATGGVTGFTTPVTGLSKDHIIADILHNPGDSPETVTYTITPLSPAGCPAGPDKVVVITVDPTPQVVPGTLTQTICNDAATNVTLGSPSTFTSGVITFNYTVTATGGVTGFTTPVTGMGKDHIIADILHNPGDSPDTVTYTIVPVSPTSCMDGPARSVIIIVNPTPQVVPGSLTQTICNDAATNVTLASPSTFTSGVITFNYTVTATGGVTGFTTPVSGLSKDHVIADILHNSGDSPETVTYTITPISPTGCPAGPDKVVVITVNPTPQVEPSSLAQTICNDGTTNITLRSPSAFSSGVITFDYTVVATGGVTGFTTPVTGLPRDHVIADTLHNPGDSPETVTYTITPISPTGCPAGPDKVVVITVNPTPQVVPSTLTQIICNDAATNVTLASPSTFTTGVITFNYTVTATGGVTGFTTPVTGLAKDHIIADILHNPGDSPETVTYTITPISPTGCPAGPDKVVVITVNPTPQVVPSTLAQTICNDAAISVTLASPSTFTSGVITFNYAVTATGGVTGFTTPVTGVAKDHIIADILHNPGDSPETVTYTITPISPTGCPAGPDKVVVITVNPTPQVVPGTLTQTICNDGTTNVTLGSPSTFTSGVVTFDYSVTSTGGVTGFTTPVTGLAKDHIIADILHNPGDSPETVTYTITPISPTGCPAGPDKVVVITVNPTPQVVPSTLAQTICNDAATSVTLSSLSTFTSGVITFNYTVTATGGVTGFTTPVTGLAKDHIIADILHNPGDSPETVTYTITPVSPTGCPAGPDKVVVITVNPTPQVVPSTLTQIICNDAATKLTLASPSTFTSGVITFNYTVTSTGGVTGFTTPVTGLAKDHIIADILHNPGDSPETVTYTITPVSPTGCPAGPDKVVVITVNPTPQVVPSTLTQIICNDAATNVTLASPSTFTTGVITFNYTVTATGGVTGFTTPVTGLAKDHIIADILHNPTDSPQTVTYTITPVSPTGCPAGPDKVVVITVNPTPQVVPSTLTQTICNDAAISVTLASPSTFTSGVITFNYTVTATGGVTGFTTPVTGVAKDHIIADILHNPGDSPETVTYTITPISPTGCPAGPDKVVVITVNPTPQVVPSTLTQIICNDAATNVTLGQLEHIYKRGNHI